MGWLLKLGTAAKEAAKWMIKRPVKSTTAGLGAITTVSVGAATWNNREVLGNHDFLGRSKGEGEGEGEDEKKGKKNNFMDNFSFGTGSLIGAGVMAIGGFLLGDPLVGLGLAAIGVVAGQPIMDAIMNATSSNPVLDRAEQIRKEKAQELEREKTTPETGRSAAAVRDAAQAAITGVDVTPASEADGPATSAPVPTRDSSPAQAPSRP